MPLHDHFHPPLTRTHQWRSVHGQWAATIARQLNAGGLPEGYYALAFCQSDGPIEIDVGALRNGVVPTEHTNGQHTYAPPEPDMAVAVAWPAVDEMRVEILSDDGETRLAAAIELVSPRNKDRQTAHTAFVAKCAEHLRHGCGLVLVDVVTTRRSDLHSELLAALGSTGPALPSLAAIAYRALGGEADGQLQVWPTPLTLGERLPTVPLWLNSELVVPLDLEASYAAMCHDLKLPT